MELWGGLECTVNRVQDAYFDQQLWSGHRDRVSADLEFIAQLGVRTLRTALHWVYFESAKSWDFFDLTLREMARLNLKPIAVLLHHGSGPKNTKLLDPDFRVKLAGYAAQVARRYSLITSYTPVNEPHTTSRFAVCEDIGIPTTEVVLATFALC